MDYRLVRYSRAGDAFHYRWAARRCLRLIDPNSSLKHITIEGSNERKARGECAIDLAEYSEVDGRESIAYFQLKHTTIRVKKTFNPSELRPTINAFAQRYRELFLKPKKKLPKGSVSFSFVTNRPIDRKLRQAVVTTARGSKPPQRFQKFLKQATGLRDRDLQGFCAVLSLSDGEGDYIVQKQRLKSQMAEYIAGFVTSQEVEGLISMVADRALPKSEDGRHNGEIFREDVLQRLGVSSERDLFPAPPEFEKLAGDIKREQHGDIFNHIIAATGPTIIHAAGGVGKSVVARQLAQSLPKGSYGFLYDCFGGGKYRNPSEPRHRAADALVQLANEIASQGLCQSLISAGKPTEVIFRTFLERLKQASTCVRDVVSNAHIVLLVDAADNAEMAAAEKGERCFANELLRETLPTGCRLVMFCRTERIMLLKPKTGKELYELQPFSKKETAAHLRHTYGDASDRDCLEFHRLTSGNPRVQANALAQRKDVEQVLSQLGPDPTTVDEQIASQLDAAILAVKDRHVDHSQVDAISIGLATLPPFVPLEVLAKAANVDVSTVRSFISDLGRPLWHTDDAVQFRDEPTETWFRSQFSATKAQITAYLAALEPLAKQYTYVAKVMPQLLLRAENYDRLVELALSDELLPENNAIDEREIRLYRLQFAFKAALRLARYADAIRLALRTGEEAAGKERQLSLLQKNLHLIAPLQGAHRVQEIAYRRTFASAWQGSQNLFSASLLSAMKDFHGEARTYLRASQKWLEIYFAEREAKVQYEGRVHSDELRDSDIAELSWAYLNLSGPSNAAKYLLSWRPPEVRFRVTRLLIHRLIDESRFDEIDQIATKGASSVHLMLAVADELLAVARFPPVQALRHSLKLLAGRATRIRKPDPSDFDDKVTSAILALLEASVARRLSRRQIQTVLRFYTPAVADWSVGTRGRRESRQVFVRATALKAVLEGKQDVPPSSLLSQQKPQKSNQRMHRLDAGELQDLTECIGALLPWYILRSKILCGQRHVARKEVQRARELSENAVRARYRTFEPLPREIFRVRFELLAFSNTVSDKDVREFIDYLRTATHFSLEDRLIAVRAVFRLPHLDKLREPLEMSCRETIEASGNDGPEERATWFTSLARAVLPTSLPDAAAYFNQAVEAVSKFGDEMVERWEALVALARRASDGRRSSPETAYRFVRCAEVVGESVAREKYWSRDDVFRVAIRLDAPSAFAALSRWRDRDVGWLDSQLEALANEAVDAGILSARVAWCLSGFEGCNGNEEFAARCVQREPSKLVQQRILDTVVRDVELAGTSSEKLRKLSATATAAQLSTITLNRLIDVCAPISGAPEEVTRVSPTISGAPSQNLKSRLDEWLDHADLLTSEGLEVALDRVARAEPPREFEAFWREVVRRIPAGKEIQFMAAFISGPDLDIYDMRAVVEAVRAKWLGKAAVKRAWQSSLKAVGRRLAIALASRGRLAFFFGEAEVDMSEIAALKSGVIEGLAESAELMDASTCFGFVRHFVDRLSTDDAADLLDYALGRFEMHIDHDFGDGPWSEWLNPPRDVSDAMIGLVWSALGSPHATVRWQAAHCVRRLIENSCGCEIALLIDRMQTGRVGPFGSQEFPFYELHARLYLLVAFARTAVEDPTALRPHAGIFGDVALEGIPHILIQKNAADIALAIERNFPSSYQAEVVAKLHRVGMSSLPVKVVDGYRYMAEVPRSTRGQDEEKFDLFFGYDFDRYWLHPMGNVFGVSEKETVRLARVAIRNLGIPSADRRSKDPRYLQWERLSRVDGKYNTWHDHGSYPRVDDYTFYHSYHACFAAAAELLAKMPVIRHTNDYGENRWEQWLDRHLLTRSDGRWLSDRRDLTPTAERHWTEKSDYQHWEWSIRTDDFIEMLRPKTSLRRSLCVSGDWEKCDGSRFEEVHVASALVDPESAESVATKLRMSDDTFWSTLPQFESGEPSNPFDLTGWIYYHVHRGERLDSLDPYAKEIDYPPRTIGETFVSLLKLSSDLERREWRLPNVLDPSVICDVWSDKRLDGLERPYSFGERIQASPDLLIMLCELTGKDLLFEVRIRRSIKGRPTTSKNDMRPLLPSRKIFILTRAGVLRDNRRQYQL